MKTLIFAIALMSMTSLAYADLSELMDFLSIKNTFDVNNPPKGVRVQRKNGSIFLEAKNYEFLSIFTFSIFGIVWNLVVILLIIMVRYSMMRNLHILVPNWYPYRNLEDTPLTTEVIIYLWIFIIPASLIGMYLIYVIYKKIFLKTEIELNDLDFKHQSNIGLTSKFSSFKLNEIKNLKLESINESGIREIKIVFKNGDFYKFGSNLKENTKEYIFYVLGENIFNKNKKLA